LQVSSLAAEMATVVFGRARDDATRMARARPR
jgi:hypothetical protein